MTTGDSLHLHAESPAPRTAVPATLGNLPRLAAMGIIRLYQLTLSPLLPANTCRFHPTCSRYGYEAIARHGLIRGGWLAFYRVLRCNPFNPGGHDPVP